MSIEWSLQVGVYLLMDYRKNICEKLKFYAFRRYVIVACDGLWKSFSNEQAISFINSTIEVENAKEVENSSDKKKQTIYEICCSRMASEAVKKLTADNVTVMVLSIQQSE
jgi:integrin-linked kinase-associated serine/threonine phosphatase 2C